MTSTSIRGVVEKSLLSYGGKTSVRMLHVVMSTRSQQCEFGRHPSPFFPLSPSPPLLFSRSPVLILPPSFPLPFSPYHRSGSSSGGRAAAAVAGVAWLLITKSADALRLTALFGATIALAGVGSLRAWRKGQSSTPYILGQAGAHSSGPTSSGKQARAGKRGKAPPSSTHCHLIFNFPSHRPPSTPPLCSARCCLGIPGIRAPASGELDQ
ncbi:unnamed protein product [Closterium sp. Naga37s-1]|nr:unnamed protein product [Closterium sp. Naga37s-1]